MADMICAICGRLGIRWMGPLSNLTHTECPHCGGQNCQRVPESDEDEGAGRDTLDTAPAADRAVAAIRARGERESADG